MNKSRFTESQNIGILKEAESGVPVTELCHTHGMSDATFYNWRTKYGGMDVSMMKHMKELEEENRRLKKMYAEERLKAEIIQEAMAKQVVKDREISIRLACRIFDIIQTNVILHNIYYAKMDFVQ